MKVKTILHNLITDVTPNMHKVRRKSLNAMVTSLVSGASLQVTSLGRNIESDTSEKHQIKRSTRLCSNTHLHQDVLNIYANLSLRLIGQKKHPIILVDWSDLDPRKQHFLLRASTAVEGRSLTLLEEIHPISSKEKPKTHRLFMAKLKAILPSGCLPVIVTDAGFRVPWFKLIESLNWDYVGRVRNKTFCKNDKSEDWHPVKDLYAQATTTAKGVGCYEMAKTNPLSCEMVVKILDKHRKYQANSIKHKNVLSYQFLGLRAFKDKQLIFQENDWIVAYNRIVELITEPYEI